VIDMPTGPRNGVLHRLRRAILARPDALSDGQLLERFLRRRDELSFAELVRRHGPMVLGVCQRILGQHADAEDAFQVTFLTLARKGGSVVPGGAVGNWLHGVADRTARKARVAAARRRVKERQAAGRPPQPPADAPADWLPLFDRELRRLPDHYRLPVVLCELEGRPRPDVARQLGIPAGTLSSRLAMARKLLADRLRRRGLAPAALAGLALAGEAPAAVPPALAAGTVRAALNQPAAAPAAPPAPGTLKGKLAMLPNRLKIAAVVVVGVVVGAVFGVPMRATPDAAPQPARKPTAPEPPPPGPPGPRTLKLDETVSRVVWSPDGTLMASIARRVEGTGDDATHYATIKLWDAKTAAEKLSLGEVKNPSIVDLAVSPDNTTLAVSLRKSIPEGDAVELWDTKTGERKRTITMDYGRSPPWLAFSPDGKLIAVAYGGPSDRLIGGARVFDTKTGERKHSLLGHASISVAVAFAPDGRSLATGGDQHDPTVMFWDLASGRRGGTLKSGGAAILSLAHSPDGKRIAVGSGSDDGKVRVWSLPGSGAQLKLDMGGSAQRVVFSRDGRLLAAVGQIETDDGRVEGAVRLWDATTGELLRTWEKTSSFSAAFAPDDKTLAILYPGGVVKLWPVETGR
jgi:RNA polymerase sigma factor (sigma-70 family)